MFEDTKAFNGFAVDDLGKAREFYSETLGVKTEVISEEEGLMSLQLAGGGQPTFVYAKEGHTPADYTILNFPVDDVEKEVDELTAKGVRFERYGAGPLETDTKGISRGNGPTIAWFKDPAGNFLALMEAESH